DIVCVDCRCNDNAQYACRLSILEVSGELEGGFEESLWVEDTKKGLQNI
ncbi:6990_t:CDS:1, partial [Funneliformis mosseae]